MTRDGKLYLECFLTALSLSALLTPVMRQIALRFRILDRPITDVKTHKKPVPYLGGVAVAASLVLSLVAARFLTNFPTGTLHALRGILLGSTIVFLLGLADDLQRYGLGYKEKFLVQIL